MAWVWVFLIIIILLVIAIIVVLLLFAGKCKKSFTKAFGSKYGPCLFDAASHTLSGEHFKQVCQIVESCPDQLQQCKQTIMGAIAKMSTPLPKPIELWKELKGSCPEVCVTKYIDVTGMSTDEQNEWVQELTAMGQYLSQHCAM